MNESNNNDYNIDDDHDGEVIMMMITIVITMFIFSTCIYFSWIKLQYNSKIINYLHIILCT